ncbi:MAG: PaaI family thioesterase [Mycobacteriaceae bacterium]
MDKVSVSAESKAAFLNTGFDNLLGLSYTELTSDGVSATWEVEPKLLQPAGIMHGGVYCSVVESVASVSGSVWLGDRGYVVGVNNNTDFLRATKSGTLFARSIPIHRGRSQQLWQVNITDPAGILVARGQVRLQNMSLPA